MTLWLRALAWVAEKWRTTPSNESLTRIASALERIASALEAEHTPPEMALFPPDAIKPRHFTPPVPTPGPFQDPIGHFLTYGDDDNG